MKKNIWKTIGRFAIALVMVCTMLSGCAKLDGGNTKSRDSAAAGAQAGGADSDQATMGIAMMNLTDTFQVNMMDGGDKAAEEFGVNVLWKSADANLDNEISIIENFIQQGVDCILMDPYDSESLIPVCEKAMEAGIPVISMGNLIESEAVISNLYNDRKDTKVIGQIIGEKVGGEGDVAMLYGATGNFVSDERQGGFKEAMDDYKNINCEYYETKWDSAAALKIVQDILAADPKIKAIHSFSDGYTTAVEQAVKQAGLEGKIIISSYDGDVKAQEKVADGTYICTLLTGAKRVGYWNVMMGAKVCKGETIEQKNYLESYLIANDDTKTFVEKSGIGYEGMNIVAPKEGIKLWEDMSLFAK